MRCPDCKGAGHVVLLVSRAPCRACGGSGEVADPVPAEPASRPWVRAFSDMAEEALWPRLRRRPVGAEEAKDAVAGIGRDIDDFILKRGRAPTLVRVSPELLDAIVEHITHRPLAVGAMRPPVRIYGVPVEADNRLMGVYWILS